MCRSLAFMYSLGLGFLAPVAGGAQTTVISPRGIGPLQLCEKLSRVTAFFPQARDTLASGEGDSQWASKIAHLPGSTRITFESSWVDSAHVWRISTNSPAYHTPRGYAVGTLVSALVAKGEKLQFGYPEGFLVITAGDSIPFLVDDASAIAFFRRDYERAPLQALDPNAHQGTLRQRRLPRKAMRDISNEPSNKRLKLAGALALRKPLCRALTGTGLRPLPVALARGSPAA